MSASEAVEALPEPERSGPAAGRRRGPRVEPPTRPGADETRSLRERIADTGGRRWIAARRPVDTAYRLGVGIVGAVVVGLGLLLIPLPGPGWVIVFGGLFVWATEFSWAERLLSYARGKVSAWTEWLGGQAGWVRAVVGLLTLAFVYGVVAVTLHLTGVPGWVPGWVPLWR